MMKKRKQSICIKKVFVEMLAYIHSHILTLFYTEKNRKKNIHSNTAVGI